MSARCTDALWVWTEQPACPTIKQYCALARPQVTATCSNVHQIAVQVLGAINTTLAQQGRMLKTGTVVDASIIAASSWTKNKNGQRDPEMHQTKKGNRWRHGMKLHIGSDAESGMVHTVIGTAANVNDVTDARDTVRELHQPLEKAEKLKASIRAKVDHPFRLIKQQFGYAKVRYRGRKKNTEREADDAVRIGQFVDGVSFASSWACSAPNERIQASKGLKI